MSAYGNSTNTTEHNSSVAAIWQAKRMLTTEWISAEAIASVSTLFSVYLVCSLTFYELKKRGFTLRRASDPNQYTATDRNSEADHSRTASPYKINYNSPAKGAHFKVERKRRRNHEEIYEPWLRALNLCAAVYAMLKCISVQMDLIWGTRGSNVCTAYAFTTVMCNGASFISVYLLLWLRQWAVHSHPALQHLPVKKLRCLSWTLLCFIVGTFISLCVLFFITIKVEASPRGCIFADEGTVSQGARSGSGIIFTAIFQPVLLGLLCYPLMKHTINRRRAFGLAAGKEAGATMKPRDKGEAKIYGLIRRLVISEVLCTVSDIGGVVGAFLLEKHPLFYIGLVYDVNITFGAYVITWSFNDWRERILPFCSDGRKAGRSNPAHSVLP